MIDPLLASTSPATHGGDAEMEGPTAVPIIRHRPTTAPSLALLDGFEKVCLRGVSRVSPSLLLLPSVPCTPSPLAIAMIQSRVVGTACLCSASRRRTGHAAPSPMTKIWACLLPAPHRARTCDNGCAPPRFVQ